MRTLLPLLARRPRLQVPRPSRAAWFVGAVWLAAFAAAVGFVARFARDCPIQDEWVLVGPLLGEEPLFPFLWQQHNEHRFPLPRLVWVGLFRLAGESFRAGIFATVGLQAGL